MQVTNSSNSSANGVAGSQRTLADAIDLNKFIELMIVELQNQDPLNPMDNAQILQQITQIHSISASAKLGNTLDAVLLGQNVATASSLLYHEVTALSDDGREVTGMVERVQITGGQARVYVDGEPVRLSNIREIVPVH